MKASLKFTLPEEEHQFNAAINGQSYKSIIEEVSEWARRLRKYSDKSTITIDELNNKINELLNDFSLNN